MNVFEFEKLQRKELPVQWKEEETLKELEDFLQKSWEERTHFYFDRCTESSQQFINFDRKEGIQLQNYIGSLLFKGEVLHIFPKLFQKKQEIDCGRGELKEELLVRNVAFWLGYCDQFHFPFLSIQNSLSKVESFLELLITLYASYTKQMVERQPYFQYENRKSIGSFIKGKINTKEYFENYYPMGKANQIPYEYSEFTLNNPLNQLMKQVCRRLIGKTDKEENKQKLRMVIRRLAEVSDMQNNVASYDCIILPAHYKNYQIILDMSRMFLHTMGNAMEKGNIESYCFLFPMERLFENFVSGLLRTCLPSNASMLTQTSDQYLAELVIDGKKIGKAFGIREDIFIQIDEKTILLDTKYKEIESLNVIHSKRFGISDHDIRQIAIYAAKRNAKQVFLIYPMHWKEEESLKKVEYEIQLQEKEPIYLEILKIPLFVENRQEEAKKRLMRWVEKIWKS